LRAEPSIELSSIQERIAAHERTAPLSVSGPPGSGKTTALAVRALRTAEQRMVTVICSNTASCESFSAAIERTGARAPNIVVDTLAGHFARWMRAESASAGASPELMVGSDVDSHAQARAAGGSILDMSWPGFREHGFTLDLPFFGRPDTLFEEAAGLFRQLRRWSVTPDEFEARCAAGLAEFYGQDVERARALCADPEVRSRASSRGREAIFADAAKLRTQRRAEADLAKVLGHVYREYVKRARGASVLCGEDIADEGLMWLSRDLAARARLASRVGAIIVDDAEDAEPATAALVGVLRAEGVTDVCAASCDAAAIDGIGGRRALSLADAHRIDLPPRTEARVATSAMRYDDEDSEADAISSSIRDLLAGGVRPNDVMVLARDEGGASVYARLLAQRGIPVTASPEAWQSPRDIADLLALACVVDDPYDHAHLLRVLSSPLVGLSDASLLTLCRDPSDAAQLPLDVGLLDVRVAGSRGTVSTTLASNALYGNTDLKLSEHGRASLVAFRERWSTWRRECAGMDPSAAIAFLIGSAGFTASWHAADLHTRSRLANDGRRLVAAAARSRAKGLREVARTLEEGFGCLAPALDARDAVTVRTILGAKGYRKPYVFVAGVAHERFPRVYVSRSMAYSKKYGLIVRENVAGGASQTAKFAWYYAKFGAKALYLEEERRALNYALSRADVAAHASGFGTPPRWAAKNDLLAAHGA